MEPKVESDTFVKFINSPQYQWLRFVSHGAFAGLVVAFLFIGPMLFSMARTWEIISVIDERVNTNTDLAKATREKQLSVDRRLIIVERELKLHNGEE